MALCMRNPWWKKWCDANTLGQDRNVTAGLWWRQLATLPRLLQSRWFCKMPLPKVQVSYMWSPLGSCQIWTMPSRDFQKSNEMRATNGNSADVLYSYPPKHSCRWLHDGFCPILAVGIILSFNSNDNYFSLPVIWHVRGKRGIQILLEARWLLESFHWMPKLSLPP